MNSNIRFQPCTIPAFSRQFLCGLLYIGMALLGGCAAFSGYPERPVDLNNDFSELKNNITAANMTVCFEKKGDEAVTCRNRFISARMYATDIRFSEFEEKLFRQTRESGFATTLGTLGLTSAAAFSTGGTSQVLSGIAAFVIGGREAFQKEVLAERTVIAIHTAMRARRSQVRLRLLEGLRQSIDNYPLALALTNINEYYDAGTILGALIGITETVGAQAKEADGKLLQLALLPKESFAPEVVELRGTLLSKIISLSDAAATALVSNPPTPISSDMTTLANEIGSTSLRRSNGMVAKKVLQAWLSHDGVLPADLPKWAKALGVNSPNP